MFSCEFCEIFKNTFFNVTTQVAATILESTIGPEPHCPKKDYIVGRVLRSQKYCEIIDMKFLFDQPQQSVSQQSGK